VNDTTPEVARLFHDLMMKRSGEERLRMGSEMFDAAREIVVSSLAKGSASSLRVRLFLRLYGSDFEPAERERILTAITGCDSSPA